MIDEAICELTPVVGVRAACRALGEPRARHYRRHRKSPTPPKPERVATPQPRALSEVERKEIRSVLNSTEHADEAPATVYAKLLGEGVYLGSVATNNSPALATRFGSSKVTSMRSIPRDTGLTESASWCWTEW